MLRLTKLSLAHRTVVLLLTLITIGLGLYSTSALKQELIPSIDVPQGSIISAYPGAAPDVIEAQVSKPIESAAKAVDGVTQVTSTSSSGISQVSVQWDYGVSADDMATKLRSAVDSIAGGLPADVDPRVVTGGTNDIPVAVLALSSNEHLNTLSQQVTDTVAPELKAIPGVRDVSVSGKEEHEIIVTYSPAKLEDEGIDPAMIGQMFQAGSTALPSGTMRTDTSNLDVQTGRTFATVKDIANLRLQGTDGPVKLGDVATVKEQPVARTTFELFWTLLRSIHGPRLLRLKGLVDIAGEPGRPLLVHAVQQILHPPIQLDAWPDADHRSRLVLIVRDIEEDTVRKLWSAFLGQAATQPQTA